MSDETKIFTKNDKNGDKCASGGQESGLKLIFEREVAILVRPWRFPGQPKKFVFFSIKVGTINSGTSLDSREQFKKTGKLEFLKSYRVFEIHDQDSAFLTPPSFCLKVFKPHLARYNNNPIFQYVSKKLILDFKRPLLPSMSFRQ